jgi:hypothetical protein
MNTLAYVIFQISDEGKSFSKIDTWLTIRIRNVGDRVEGRKKPNVAA